MSFLGDTGVIFFRKGELGGWGKGWMMKDSRVWGVEGIMAKAFSRYRENTHITLREMSNFVEFTGPWYSTTPGES